MVQASAGGLKVDGIKTVGAHVKEKEREITSSGR